MTRLFHVCELHVPHPRDKMRIEAARSSWDALYAAGVVQCHLVVWTRSAIFIGDRDLPYLKDVLHHAMSQAGDDDVILFTNSDVALHPALVPLLQFHVPVFECCSAQRLDYADAHTAQGEKHIGRDLFAFTKRWLVEKWSEIPDFILGCSEWDLCLAGMIRLHHGISLVKHPTSEVIHPAEIPVGYVTHVKHNAEWMHPTYVDTAPAQVHNKRLFREWREKYANPKPVLPLSKNGRPIISVRRTSSLGDVLAASCVADKLIEMGYDVEWHCHHTAQHLMRRHPGLLSVSDPDGKEIVDLDDAYESDPERTKKHFARMFIDRANLHLARCHIKIPQVADIAPRIYPDPAVRARILPVLESYPRPWVLICPKSHSWANRTVPDAIWKEATKDILGTKFWLGPNPAPAGIVDLECRSVNLLAEYIGASDLLVSPDTGPAHISLAMGVPAIVIGQSSDPALHFSDQRDWLAIYPALPCLNCQTATCLLHKPSAPPCQEIPPAMIVEAVNSRLRQYLTDDVSAVICVYKPDSGRLNKCLAAVLPQVQEIVVVGNLDSEWPIRGAMQDPKIRYIQRQEAGIGYSRNVNLGVRHTNSPWIWTVNDDCFPSPDVAQKLLTIAKADDRVGAVTHTLMYSGGRGIQYAGQYRERGGMGFGHLDHHGSTVRYSSPVEQESVCGASMLLRRKALYEAGAYPECYRLYSEDTHLAMALRQAGWKLMFEPRAVGIHDEHQSTSKVNGLNDILRESSAIFARKWGHYFERNPDPSKLGTFV